MESNIDPVARKKRLQGDGGATMVEFALLAPLLFLLIFAIIEFGWAFGQHLDVRHGAREASRLAAVNYGMDSGLSGTAQTNAIGQATCDRMDLDGTTSVALAYTVVGDQAVGDFADVTVTHPLNTITGFLDFALNGVTLESTVSTRIERGDDDATWTAGTFNCP